MKKKSFLTGKITVIYSKILKINIKVCKRTMSTIVLF